ncbi:cardiolipin synthase ClsB [Oxalobacteraceae bacterium CAVE-383]|nr:cardiolipin synthase ClsB [Oxalobacteraceae bacterium CAVE-383]
MRHLKYSIDNEIALLHCGAEFFPALIAAIDAARTEIYLETYIFSLDDTGAQVRDALQRAARRGVQVCVITDWLGTGRKVSGILKRELREAGVHHRSFNPWFKRGVARSHRKLCVVDRQIAFVGGLNINDDFYSDDSLHVRLPERRWDFGISIVGPLVQDVFEEMQAQWQRLGPLKLRTRWKNFQKGRIRHTGVPTHGSAMAALVVRDNLRNRRTIQRAYLQALGQAHHSAYLANPYFAPGRKLRRALEQAAVRGVRVTLLLGVGQFAMQDAVANWFYPKLLKCGVRIVEYRKTQLHGKVAVVDDEWATVGSSNYDGLSLFVNQEANVVINDDAFARSLREQIQRGVADGTEVLAAEFAHTPWYRRARHAVAFFVYRSVIHVITLGKDA